jgi:hypothetical protein
MRVFLLAGLAAVSVLFARPVLAESHRDVSLDEGGRVEPPSPAPESPDKKDAPPAEHWYGWQTLLVDASVVVVAFGLSAATSDRAPWVGASLPAVAVGGFLLGGPVVHAAHGRWNTAAASLAVRAGLPVGGALVGAGIASVTCGSSCRFGGGDGGDVPYALLGAAFGGVIGVIAAPFVDAGGFAYEPDPTASAHVFVAPTVAWAPGAASVGLAGQF